MGQYIIGVDVGGTKIAYGLFEEDQTLLRKYKHPTHKELSAEALTDGIIDTIRTILREQGLQPEDILGIGVALPSFIHFGEGKVLKTSNIPNLKDFAFRDYMQNALGIPTVLDNDANVAALAEHRHGAGRGFDHILYCPISTGIGNGIIINNRLFRGTHGFAGESGHMLVELEGDLHCDCGHSGCFESHISGAMIVQRVARRIREGHPSVMSEMCGGDLSAITAKTIEDAYYQGDEVAIWALDHMALYLGVWLYNLYLAFDIDCYVFGGGMTRFGAPLFDRVRRVFDQYKQDGFAVYFHIAELGQDFGIIGAAELAADELG